MSIQSISRSFIEPTAVTELRSLQEGPIVSLENRLID